MKEMFIINIIEVIVPLFFIASILQQVRYIKELIIPTRKSYVEIIIVSFGVIIFMCITYFYAKTWIHYLIGILAMFTFFSMYLKEGISSKGFLSMYRHKETILWNEIKKVHIINSNNVKIKVYGNFMEQTFRFKKNDYDKIINILKKNLDKQAEIQMKLK